MVKAKYLSPINLQVISPLNIPKQGSPQDQEGWAGETEIEVETIHALAPGAKFIVLQSPVSQIEGIVGLPQDRQLEQYILYQWIAVTFIYSMYTAMRKSTAANRRIRIFLCFARETERRTPTIPPRIPPRRYSATITQLM
jgi:hypothetical protein